MQRLMWHPYASQTCAPTSATICARWDLPLLIEAKLIIIGLHDPRGIGGGLLIEWAFHEGNKHRGSKLEVGPALSRCPVTGVQMCASVRGHLTPHVTSRDLCTAAQLVTGHLTQDWAKNLHETEVPLLMACMRRLAQLRPHHIYLSWCRSLRLCSRCINDLNTCHLLPTSSLCAGAGV